ncbi:MAG: hypothetical protein EPO42_07185 [Gallionellaceae bacterium]|nr:MAG: hypothetical protein EPO42_07185 [Gallionellaceae bacterium]
MELSFEQGTPATLRLALLPLKKVGTQIAADMDAAGTGKRCGVCRKSFNAARKWRSIARLTYGGRAVMMISWKLCGKCSHTAALNGGKVPDCLKQEAEGVREAARLAMTDAQGTA